MKSIQNIFIFIWRTWFYGWVFFSLVPIFPLLLIILSKEKWYPTFYKVAHFWGKTMLFIMGFTMKIEGSEKIDAKKSYIFCPNHTSMIDIMLMFALSKNPFVFVGKKELAKIPVFGYIFKKSSILVDRSSAVSARNAFEDAKRKLASGRSVCIFPEGKVPEEHIILDKFKSGAFRMAIEHKTPIIPITFYDCKRLFSYTFFSGSPGKLRVKIHDVIPTNTLEMQDRNKLKLKVHAILLKSLELS